MTNLTLDDPTNVTTTDYGLATTRSATGELIAIMRVPSPETQINGQMLDCHYLHLDDGNTNNRMMIRAAPSPNCHLNRAQRRALAKKY